MGSPTATSWPLEGYCVSFMGSFVFHIMFLPLLASESYVKQVEREVVEWAPDESTWPTSKIRKMIRLQLYINL